MLGVRRVYILRRIGFSKPQSGRRSWDQHSAVAYSSRILRGLPESLMALEAQRVQRCGFEILDYSARTALIYTRSRESLPANAKVFVNNANNGQLTPQQSATSLIRALTLRPDKHAEPTIRKTSADRKGTDMSTVDEYQSGPRSGLARSYSLGSIKESRKPAWACGNGATTSHFGDRTCSDG